MNTYQPNYFYNNNFEIAEIIFDDETADVTLNGRFYTDGGATANKCVFSCDFSILTNILLRAGAEAEVVIDSICDKLSGVFIESPTIIDLNTITGDTLWVTGVNLKIYKLHIEAEDGIWEPSPDNIFVIDSIAKEEAWKLN